MKKGDEGLSDEILRRNYIVNLSISLFIAFLLAYTLYRRITLSIQGNDNFIKIFLAAYFLVAFIPLYRLVDLTAFKHSISIFKKYGIPKTILLHYEELKIKSGWFFFHLFLAMAFFVSIFAATE